MKDSKQKTWFGGLGRDLHPFAKLAHRNPRFLFSSSAGNSRFPTPSRSLPVVIIWWARQGSNLRPTGYAYHFDFSRLFRVRGLDCPFIHLSLDKLGCLSTSLYTPLNGARDCHSFNALGFPEFDKNHSSITRRAALV